MAFLESHANVGRNLAVLFAAIGVSHAKIAEKMEEARKAGLIDKSINKTTFGKWATQGISPAQSSVELLKNFIAKDEEILARLARVNVAVEEINSDYLRMDPAAFGLRLKISIRRVENIIGKSSADLFTEYSDDSAPKIQDSMSKLTGLWYTYMASVYYPEKICRRVMKIYYIDSGYEFVEANKEHLDLKELWHHGKAELFYNNVRLQGREIKQNHDVITNFYVLPKTVPFKEMFGWTVSVNRERQMKPSPLLARVINADPNDNVERYLKDKVYLEYSEQKDVAKKLYEIGKEFLDSWDAKRPWAGV